MDDYLAWQGRIWYVDDDNVLAKIAEMGLSMAFPKVHIRIFSDGITALAEYDANPAQGPDILLTDYVMEPMNGGQLIREFRKRNPECPAAIFTSTPKNAQEDAAELHVPVFDKKEIRIVRQNLAQTLYALAVKQ